MKKFANRNSRFKVRERLESLFPNKRESEESRQFKVILWGIISIFVLAVVLGGIGFFFTLQGPETIMVPTLEGMALIDAIEELQDRALSFHVQTRYFQTQAGSVINQQPGAGSQVRVGRTINLTVSRGPVLDQVGNYVGMTLNELRRQLSTQFATHEPLLEVKRENISYVFSEEPEQTILAQEPEEGQKLAAYAELTLLVSRGAEAIGVEAPQTIGLDYRQALGLLAGRNIPFVFRYSDQAGTQAIGQTIGQASGQTDGTIEQGVVVGQSPEAGQRISGNLELIIHPLEAGSINQQAGIFSRALPRTPRPVNVVVQFINSVGETKPYFQTTRLGGEFSFPYSYDSGSTIQVFVDNELLPESEPPAQTSAQQPGQTSAQPEQQPEQAQAPTQQPGQQPEQEQPNEQAEGGQVDNAETP